MVQSEDTSTFIQRCIIIRSRWENILKSKMLPLHYELIRVSDFTLDSSVSNCVDSRTEFAEDVHAATYFPGKLMDHHERWISPRRCTFPQEVGLCVSSLTARQQSALNIWNDGPPFIKSLRLVVKRPRVPQKISVYMSMDDERLKMSNVDPVSAYLSAEFELCGTMTWNMSKKNSFCNQKALKIDAKCHFLKLLIEEPVPDSQNLHRQVAISEIGVLGMSQVEDNHHRRESGKQTVITDETFLMSIQFFQSGKPEVDELKNALLDAGVPLEVVCGIIHDEEEVPIKSDKNKAEIETLAVEVDQSDGSNEIPVVPSSPPRSSGLLPDFQSHLDLAPPSFAWKFVFEPGLNDSPFDQAMRLWLKEESEESFNQPLHDPNSPHIDIEKCCASIMFPDLTDLHMKQLEVLFYAFGGFFSHCICSHEWPIRRASIFVAERMACLHRQVIGIQLSHESYVGLICHIFENEMHSSVLEACLHLLRTVYEASEPTKNTSQVYGTSTLFEGLVFSGLFHIVDPLLRNRKWRQDKHLRSRLQETARFLLHQSHTKSSFLRSLLRMDSPYAAAGTPEALILRAKEELEPESVLEIENRLIVLRGSMKEIVDVLTRSGSAMQDQEDPNATHLAEVLAELEDKLDQAVAMKTHPKIFTVAQECIEYLTAAGLTEDIYSKIKTSQSASLEELHRKSRLRRDQEQIHESLGRKFPFTQESSKQIMDDFRRQRSQAIRPHALFTHIFTPETLAGFQSVGILTKGNIQFQGSAETRSPHMTSLQILGSHDKNHVEASNSAIDLLPISTQNQGSVETQSPRMVHDKSHVEASNPGIDPTPGIDPLPISTQDQGSLETEIPRTAVLLQVSEEKKTPRSGRSQISFDDLELENDEENTVMSEEGASSARIMADIAELAFDIGKVKNLQIESQNDPVSARSSTRPAGHVLTFGLSKDPVDEKESTTAENNLEKESQNDLVSARSSARLAGDVVKAKDQVDEKESTTVASTVTNNATDVTITRSNNDIVPPAHSPTTRVQTAPSSTVSPAHSPSRENLKTAPPGATRSSGCVIQ